MLQSISIIASILAFAIASTTASPLPISSRDVGVLTCETVATGKLAFVKGDSIVYAALTDYRLDDAVKDVNPSATAPKGDGNPKVLTATSTTEPQNWIFSACTSDRGSKDSFYGASPYVKKGNTETYWGHIGVTAAPHHVLSRYIYEADTAFLTSSKQSLSDDSSQLLQGFQLVKTGNKSVVSYLGHTAAKGAFPSKDLKGTYAEVPGSAKAPYVYLHKGSADFSDYTLQLL